MPRPLPPALLWPLAVLVGIALFWLTNLTEPPAATTLNFGTEYAAMAENLSGYVGRFPHRILAPLLGRGVDEVAHWFGGAVPYWQFAHACTVLFIAVLFASCSLLGARLWQALLLTAAISFTGAVQIYKGHVGYPEPITFALLLGSMIASRRPALFWTLMFCNVMHHEQIFFFWPWLLWWRYQHGQARWQHDVVGAAVVAGLYVAWRYHVGNQLTPEQAQVAMSMGYYLEMKKYFPVGTLGLAILNVLSTFIWFGLWPLVIVWHASADGWRRAALPLLLYVACLHAIFGVAHDVYRFTCFMFVPVMLAGLRLFQLRGGAWLVIAFGVASAFAIKQQAQVFLDVGIQVMYEVGPDGNLQLRAEKALDIVPKVIPLRPWTFAAYGAAVLATLALGIAWGRRCRPAPPTP